MPQIEYRADLEYRKGALSFKSAKTNFTFLPGVNEVTEEVLESLKDTDYFQHLQELNILVMLESPKEATRPPARTLRAKTTDKLVESNKDLDEDE